MILIAAAIGYLPVHELDIELLFTPTMVLNIWLVLVPLAIFAASMQLVTSFLAKTFKEAQSYISFTILVPMFVPFIIQMGNIDNPILKWLPITGQNEMITDYVKGLDIDLMAVLACSAGSLALAGVFIAIMAKGLKTEKMILGL